MRWRVSGRHVDGMIDRVETPWDSMVLLPHFKLQLTLHTIYPCGGAERW